MKKLIEKIEDRLSPLEDELSRINANNSVAYSENYILLDDVFTVEDVQRLIAAVRCASRWAITAENVSKGMGQAMLTDMINKLRGKDASL